jgi:hypothetical protein
MLALKLVRLDKVARKGLRMDTSEGEKKTWGSKFEPAPKRQNIQKLPQKH